MEASQLDLIFGWAALLSAVATMGTLITGILFFAVNETFGKANDTVSVLQVVLMLPVAVAMYLLTHPGNEGLALLALAVGSMGMIIAAVLQTLLVLGVASFEQTIGAVLSAGAAIGLWLVLANVLALTGGIAVGPGSVWHSSRRRLPAVSGWLSQRWAATPVVLCGQLSDRGGLFGLGNVAGSSSANRRSWNRRSLVPRLDLALGDILN